MMVYYQKKLCLRMFCSICELYIVFFLFLDIFDVSWTNVLRDWKWHDKINSHQNMLLLVYITNKKGDQMTIVVNNQNS